MRKFCEAVLFIFTRWKNKTMVSNKDTKGDKGSQMTISIYGYFIFD